MLKLYKNPKNVGWLGWFEDEKGDAMAFITMEGRIIAFEQYIEKQLEKQ